MKINGRIKLALLAVCLPALMSGQGISAGVKSIAQKLDCYRITNPFEELWLHTDRESYAAGETVRVKAYLLTYPALTISKKESYAYVELLDYYCNPVAQVTVRLTRGTGESEFLLPDSLVTGSYLLRAYTSVMKNYMPYGCFMKKITVANPFRKGYIDLYSHLRSGHKAPSAIDIFPEGGRLVGGLLTTVGVTVLNQYGYPAACSAVVTNEDNEVIAEVSVDTTGIGSFDFVPEPGGKYFLTPTGTGRRYPLPQVSAVGFNLRVTVPDSETVRILLRGRDEEGANAHGGGLILIQSRGEVVFTRELPSWTGEYEIKVPAARMAKGINNIVAFDAAGNFLTERYLFMPPAVAGSIRLSYNDHPARREKTELRIDDPQNRLTPDSMIPGSISVSASATADRIMTASDYLLLGSEFWHGANALQLTYNFPHLTPEARNSLLLGIKSTWVNWSKIASGRCDPPLFPEEVDGMWLAASLAGSSEMTAARKLTAFLVGWGKRHSFQYAETDTTGRFLFFLDNNYETDDIIIMTDDRGNYHPLKLEGRFSDRYLANDFMPDTTPMPAVMNELDKLAARYQVRKIYGIPNSQKSDTTNRQPDNYWRFYGIPDQELRLDDYISLSSMREIFFELVKRMAVRNDRREGGEVIWDPVLKRSPALFIDLVPVDDAETILGLDPTSVKQIDIITGDYLFGDIVFPGILNVITRKGNFSDIPLPANTLRTPFAMADPPAPFISPDHSQGDNSRIPDFRNTLYWNGNLRRDNNGNLSVEFWSSDDTQGYEISINLVDRESKIISATGELSLTGR